MSRSILGETAIEEIERNEERMKEPMFCEFCGCVFKADEHGNCIRCGGEDEPQEATPEGGIEGECPHCGHVPGGEAPVTPDPSILMQAFFVTYIEYGAHDDNEGQTLVIAETMIGAIKQVQQDEPTYRGVIGVSKHEGGIWRKP